MTTFGLNDVEAIENGAESEEDYFCALQRAINSLDAWKLQGSYGRSMMGAIESGQCMLAESGTRDAWGNYIPGRDEVETGSKGSVEFVRSRMGDDWVAMLLSVDEDTI